MKNCLINVFFIVIDFAVVSACESRYPNGQKRLLGSKTTPLPLAWFLYVNRLLIKCYKKLYSAITCIWHSLQSNFNLKRLPSPEIMYNGSA